VAQLSTLGGFAHHKQTTKHKHMKKLIIPVFVSLLVFTGLMVSAQEPTVNPTGTWKVTHSSTNTQARPSEYTLKLKLVSNTLTGTISNVSSVNGKSRVYEWPIRDAKLQGGEISFSVTHPFEIGHGEVTSSYQGKISGDAIMGTFKETFLKHTYTRNWTAERVKE
jgi:hypothetical protein